MFIEANIFTNPSAEIRQPFMADTPKVIDRITRSPPDVAFGQPEGYSYSVQMPNNGGLREVFMLHDAEVGILDYRYMHFVAQGSEGDNFYKTPRKNRFTGEVVTAAIVNAAREYDNDPDNFKKKIGIEPTEPNGAPGAHRYVAVNALH